MSSGRIELKDVYRRYGATTALNGISLRIAEGSFTTLLGPSGCGKSTTLRIVAGLEPQSAGQVLIDGRDVAGLRAAERNIAMVFQSYALYPHMTVRQNINLPLAMRNMNVWQRLPLMDRLLASARDLEAAHRTKVREIASLLDIETLLDRKPSQLSGGQKQRAAVARALVRDPVAFLLDEPLSNLDVKLRLQMRGELVDLHQRTGRTFVYVTHDQAEAMSMSDQIAVMMDGSIVQSGTPRAIYERPATREIAAFVGDHPLNLVEVQASSSELPEPFTSFAFDTRLTNDTVVIGLRPEVLVPADDGLLAGRVARIEYLGSEAVATVVLAGDRTIRAVLPTHSALRQPGDEIRFNFDSDHAHLFDGSTGARLEARLVPRSPLRATATGPAS
ncbi:MAG: ABC transporter ATP-binding protein [Deltaproteobacteria bacterium]|nr:ABC transporter ATP-binding protein [Deltaproteobacteria bacterium]